jgi:hypothetical protein
MLPFLQAPSANIETATSINNCILMFANFEFDYKTPFANKYCINLTASVRQM